MNISPKHIVNVGIALAGAYIFLNQDKLEEAWPWFIPIAALGIAIYTFNDKFIEKSEVQEPEGPQIGPSEPFAPVKDPLWDIDPKTGAPYRIKSAPPRRK